VVGFGEGEGDADADGLGVGVGVPDPPNAKSIASLLLKVLPESVPLWQWYVPVEV